MPSLLLHADEPCWLPPDRSALTALLQELGLAGAEKAGGRGDEYWVGDRFLNLVMFLGCSPQVLIDPNDAPPGQPVCYLRLLSFAEPAFLSAPRLPAVRCANCRTPLQRFESGPHDRVVVCGRCGKQSELKDLDWRQAAGFASYFIEISGIHPQEALPSDSLLFRLGDYSQSHWKYFYA